MIEYDRKKVSNVLYTKTQLSHETIRETLDAIEAALSVEKKAAPRLPSRINKPLYSPEFAVNDLIDYLQHYAPLLEELATRK